MIKKQNNLKQAGCETEKDHGRDTKKFVQLPVKTKELEILRDEAEKSTGQANIELNRLIQEKSKRRDS